MEWTDFQFRNDIAGKCVKISVYFFEVLEHVLGTHLHPAHHGSVV